MAALLAAGLLPWPQPAQARDEAGDAAAAPSSPWPGATLRGRGVLRFFGLRVYEARLWTEPVFDAGHYERSRLALELHYSRALEGAAIVERSLTEMRRLEPLDSVREARWRALMRRAFPDISAGDRLSGLHDGAGGVRVLHNGRDTATTDEPDFARLFFGIWLAPQTSEPALRRALLGP